MKEKQAKIKKAETKTKAQLDQEAAEDIRKIKSDPKFAADFFYETIKPMVRTIARKLCNCYKEDIDPTDICTALYIALWDNGTWNRLDSYDYKGYFFSWLSLIATHEAFRHFDKLGYRRFRAITTGNTRIRLLRQPLEVRKDVVNLVEDKDQLRFTFTVSGKTLDPQLEDLTKLLEEILLHSRFDEGARIRELLTRTRAGLEQAIVNSGQSYGMMRAGSYIRRETWIREQMGGIAYYQWLEDLLHNWDENVPVLQEKVAELARKIFTRDQFVSQMTADESMLGEAVQVLDRFVASFPEDAYPQDDHPFEPDIRNEGIMTGSNVQYVCQVADYEAFGEEYHGSMAVASTFLSRDYMHNQIRAQGGAYGAGIRMSTDGSLGAYSYRDPQITRTLDVYKKLADQLADNELTEEERTVYIIGSMGSFDPPRTPQSEGSGDLSAYITGRTYEQRQAWLEQALATTNEDLAALGEILRKGFNEGPVYCVVGASAKIREEEQLFGTLVQLSK